MILEVCNTVAVLSVIKILLKIFNVLRVIIPGILVISIIISIKDKLIYHKLFKHITKSVILKFIIAVLILFIPNVTNTIINKIPYKENSYLNCIRNANDDDIDKILVKEINDGINTLKNNLDSYIYFKINIKINNINNNNTKSKYLNELKNVKTYIDLNNEIMKLENCNTSDYKNYISKIDSVTDNTIKETLNTTLKNICNQKELSETGIITKTNNLTYHVFIPENATTNMPLVMYLHGDGSTSQALSNKFWANAKEIYGEDVPFIVVAPEGGMWAETDGRLENLKNIIEDVCTKYVCDEDRIIITGHSRGAIGTWALINKYPNIFYAAVPVSCFGTVDANNLINTKIWAFSGNYGEAEIIYASSMKEIIESVNDAGGNAKYTSLDGGHGDTPSLAYTKELYEWLLE